MGYLVNWLKSWKVAKVEGWVEMVIWLLVIWLRVNVIDSPQTTDHYYQLERNSEILMPFFEIDHPPISNGF